MLYAFQRTDHLNSKKINRDLISRVLSVNASQVGQGISGVVGVTHNNDSL